jgi:hypothetical protein
MPSEGDVDSHLLDSDPGVGAWTSRHDALVGENARYLRMRQKRPMRHERFGALWPQRDKRSVPADEVDNPPRMPVLAWRPLRRLFASTRLYASHGFNHHRPSPKRSNAGQPWLHLRVQRFYQSRSIRLSRAILRLDNSFLRSFSCDLSLDTASPLVYEPFSSARRRSRRGAGAIFCSVSVTRKARRVSTRVKSAWPRV